MGCYISGVVMNGPRGMSGVSVKATSTSFTAGPVTTDGNGDFSFADVPAGTYTFTASMPGYEQGESPSNTITVSGDNSYNVLLGVSSTSPTSSTDYFQQYLVPEDSGPAVKGESDDPAFEAPGKVSEVRK
jgi:hypothetical protein